MKKNYPQIKKVYVVGMEGLVEEFETAGYQVVDSKIHDGESFRSAIPYGSFPIEKDIQAVVNFSKAKILGIFLGFWSGLRIQLLQIMVCDFLHLR